MANNVEASSAAGKVFGTFELLENILIQLADLDITDRFANREHLLQDLYRMQRVDSTFRNVLARSRPLRILMFKEAICNEADADIHQFRPIGGLQSYRNRNPLVDELRWMIDPIWSSCSIILQDKVGRFVCHGTVHTYRWTPTALKAWESDTASPWRQLLVARIPTSFIFKLRIEIFEDLQRDFYSFELKKGATLGEFADMVVEGILEFHKKHYGRPVSEWNNSARDQDEDESTEDDDSSIEDD